MAQSQSDKNRMQGGGSQLLNPIGFKNFTPTQLLPQDGPATVSKSQLFFDVNRSPSFIATPENSYAAYPTRTLPFISNAIFGNQY